jgi:hypothetical protein
VGKWGSIYKGLARRDYDMEDMVRKVDAFLGYENKVNGGKES